MRAFGILLLCVGVSLIIIGIVRDNIEKNAVSTTKVEYRYIPRTFIEAQNEPVPLQDIFKDMFEKQSPFIRDFNQEFGVDRRTNQNAFYISQ